MLKILLVGEDFGLLATRAGVLSKTGASVVCCNKAEMIRDLTLEFFDLVVLCHSLSPGAADDVTAVARRWWPHARVMLLVSQLSGSAPAKTRSDSVVSAQPVPMLREAIALLRSIPGQSMDDTPRRKN